MSNGIIKVQLIEGHVNWKVYKKNETMAMPMKVDKVLKYSSVQLQFDPYKN